MEHPVLIAIRRAGFTPFGWFEPSPSDGVPKPARFVILIGNAGPDMFRRFARERNPAAGRLDDWTRDVVMALHQIACRGLLPGLTIYLDIDLDTSLERAHARNRLIEDKDERRMDEQAVEFHHRVRLEYLKLAEMEPGRIKVIDGRADRKTIAARIWETVHRV